MRALALPGRRCLAVAALTLALGATTARALPGDPPIVPLSPTDGASVRATSASITVTYRCPGYRKEIYGDPADPNVDVGGPDDYDVDFSRVPSLDGDGRLVGRASAVSGSAKVGPDGATCSSELGRAGGSDEPAKTGGRVYWQAHRDCYGCAEQRDETGPVRSFVVSPAPVRATLRVPRRLYAGYRGVFDLQTRADLTGTTIVLQRRVGKRWRTVAEDGFRVPLIAALPGGRQRLRAVARTAFSARPLATRVVTVRRGGRRATSGRDDGRYALPGTGPKSLLELRITDGGRRLRSFRATVTSLCSLGPPPVFETRFAAVDSVAIAPDGSVVYQRETRGGSVTRLLGRVRRRRFSGTIFVAIGPCVGTRQVNVVRKG